VHNESQGNVSLHLALVYALRNEFYYKKVIFDTASRVVLLVKLFLEFQVDYGK
jgi:hypothetical protein